MDQKVDFSVSRKGVGGGKVRKTFKMNSEDLASLKVHLIGMVSECLRDLDQSIKKVDAVSMCM